MSRLCTTCKTEKPAAMFSKRLGGLAYTCKPCASEKRKQWYAQLPPDRKAAMLAKDAERYAGDKDHARRLHAEWREKNAESRKEYMQRYYKANRDKWVLPLDVDAQRVARRKAAERQAVPAWSDNDFVKDIYTYAAIMRQAGIDCHVDHIVPLKSKRVCGLHAHTNLTVINAFENRSKGNRHWPDA